MDLIIRTIQISTTHLTKNYIVKGGVLIHRDDEEWDIYGYPGEYVYGDDYYVSDKYLDEKWLPIYSFPGYWVSNMGRVFGRGRHGHGVLLTIRKDEQGHEYVSMTRNGKRYRRFVHHLMGDAFIPNPEGYPMVRHLNDIPDDNELENLAWGDHWHNMQDSIQNGTALCLRKRIPVRAIDLISGQEYIFDSLTEAAEELNVCISAITLVLRGTRHQSNGYAFEYLDRKIPTKTIGPIRNWHAKIRAIDLETGKSYLFESQEEAGRVLNINSRSINKMLRGRNKSAGGYVFEYVYERD